jgi:hypothetical protein
VDIAPVELRYYQTVSGKRPFADWLDSLDAETQQIAADIRKARAFWLDYLRRERR